MTYMLFDQLLLTIIPLYTILEKLSQQSIRMGNFNLTAYEVVF